MILQARNVCNTSLPPQFLNSDLWYSHAQKKSHVNDGKFIRQQSQKAKCINQFEWTFVIVGQMSATKYAYVSHPPPSTTYICMYICTYNIIMKRG